MSTSRLAGAGLPHVNLLPPEITAARGLKTIKNWLALGLLAVVVACAGLYLVAALAQSAAQDDLSTAEQTGRDLSAEKLKYADVPIVKAQLATTGGALAAGMANDVDWAGYSAALVATLPPGVSLNDSKVSFNAAATDTASNPIYQASIGQIEFTGRSLTVPDTQAWITSLLTVPGFVDPLMSTMTVAGKDGQTYYETTASVRFTADALTHRFDNSGQETVAP